MEDLQGYNKKQLRNRVQEGWGQMVMGVGVGVIEEGHGSARGPGHLDLQRSRDGRGWSADSRIHFSFLCLWPAGNHATIGERVSVDGR